MSSLKINLHFLEMEIEPNDSDRDAAWDLYVELLTRITTQPLLEQEGDEAAALASVHSLFALTRETLKKHGKGCREFAKLAVVVLNQIVRPFTAKWHRLSLTGAFQKKPSRSEFRRELSAIQEKLRCYTQMLAELAGVEDLTNLEKT